MCKNRIKNGYVENVNMRQVLDISISYWLFKLKYFFFDDLKKRFKLILFHFFISEFTQGMILPTANGMAKTTTSQSKAKLNKTQVRKLPHYPTQLLSLNDLHHRSTDPPSPHFLLYSCCGTDFLLRQHSCSDQHRRQDPHLQVQHEGKVPHLPGWSLQGLPQPGCKLPLHIWLLSAHSSHRWFEE